MAHDDSADQSPYMKTHLFTVRLWQAPAGHSSNAIRGKAQHVISGEVRYFSDWHSLQDFLIQQMRNGDEPAIE